MIDTQILGETAAKCMEYMDEAESLNGGSILAVGIVVVAQNESKELTFTRTFCSETEYYRQVGLLTAGAECLREGFRSWGKDGDPDEDEDDE